MRANPRFELPSQASIICPPPLAVDHPMCKICLPRSRDSGGFDTYLDELFCIREKCINFRGKVALLFFLLGHGINAQSCRTPPITRITRRLQALAYVSRGNTGKDDFLEKQCLAGFRFARSLSRLWKKISYILVYGVLLSKCPAQSIYE
jgi:hypothetical protein